MSYHDQTVIYVGMVQLRIEDLGRSIQFYQDVLGFQILEQNDGRAKLSADGHRTILSLVQPVDISPKSGKTAGLYHFALLLPARSDFAQFVAHLANQGIRFGGSNHLVSEA